MTAYHAFILVSSGLVSGAMNSLAGGGSFVAFPVLVFLGLLPIEANATATFAVFPGTVSTLFIYRKELLKHKEKLPFYISLSTIGGAFGALLLINISNESFATIVPYLLLMATLLFTARPVINKITRQRVVGSGSVAYRALMILLLIAICIYGGFFGAGMGILMLALLSLMGMQNIHEMNSLRACVGLFANIIAIVFFGISGLIQWQYAAIMAIGCILGGYFGAHYALKLKPSISQMIVIIIGWSMTVYFFWKNV